MASFTPEEFGKLPPEAQEAIVKVESLRLRKHEDLLRKARLHHGFYLVPFLLAAGLIVVLVGENRETYAIPFCIFALTVLIQFHAANVNRRIDALLELLDAEMKRRTPPPE